MTKLLVNFPRKIVYLLRFEILVIYILVLLFQLMLQENTVKVVLRNAIGSVNVYTIWRLFVLRYWDLTLGAMTPGGLSKN